MYSCSGGSRLRCYILFAMLVLHMINGCYHQGGGVGVVTLYLSESLRMKLKPYYLQFFLRIKVNALLCYSSYAMKRKYGATGTCSHKSGLVANYKPPI